MKQEEKNRHWKVLTSEYLYREPWLTVRKDSVELPNGGRIPSYYVHEYPDWVNVIAITKDKKFLMIRQYRHALGQVSYELCAGVTETFDGSPLVSAQRELMEETGYGNGTWREFMVVSPNPSTNTNLVYCYLATDIEQISQPSPESTEDLTVHLLSFDEVKALLSADEIKQALMAAPLWRFVAEHPNGI